MRLFQIWLTPRTHDGEPRWKQRRFNFDQASNGFVIFASGASADVDAGALHINADARRLHAKMCSGESHAYRMVQGTRIYLVPTTGRVRVNDVCLAARDGAAIVDENSLMITASTRRPSRCSKRVRYSSALRPNCRHCRSWTEQLPSQAC
ncbi:pirin family protein [Caballeronia arvi]|uniref:pirin family protein n=1 Tax=Caballeronia arvi TaxID=1777135 RepID=UPI001F42BF4B|nr:hypothetical protein [Caballeronia arvi]